MARVALLGAVFAGSVMTTVPALAEDSSESAAEPKKVLVGKLAGAKPTSARGWIVEGLENDLRFDVLPEDISLSLPTGSAEHRIASFAAKHEADAVILGRSRFGKGWNADLEIYDGKTGALIEKVTVKGGSFQNYESALTAGDAYFDIVDKAEGFPPPEPEAAPEPEEEAEEEEEAAEVSLDSDDLPDAAPGGRPSALDVAAGIRLYSRAFRYSDTLAQRGADGAEALVDYNLDAGPMPLIHLNWYPMAHFGGGFASHIGITGGFEQGIATKVRYETAAEVQTFSQNHNYYYAGLRGRIPVSLFNFGVSGKYAGHSFALKDSEDSLPSDLFPNVSYSLLEFGADAEARIGKIVLGVRGAFLMPLGLGDIATSEWFEDASASGIALGGHVGFAVASSLDILAGVDVRAYGFDFDPQPGDPDNRIAGGATDRYMSAYAALRFTLPGDEPAGGGAADSGAGEDADDDLDFD